MALEKAKDQLKILYIKALKDLGRDKSLLFEVHQMLMQDEDFVDEVKRAAIESGLSVLTHAVSMVGENFANMMSAMDDEYICRLGPRF